MKLFEYMIRMDVTEAACVTHGGVIMSMLSSARCPPAPGAVDGRPRLRLHRADRCAAVDAGPSGGSIDIVPFGYADTLRGQAETEENEAFE